MFNISGPTLLGLDVYHTLQEGKPSMGHPKLISFIFSRLKISFLKHI